MIPPDCYVCGRGLRDIPQNEDFDSHFTLVYFGPKSNEVDPYTQALLDARGPHHPANAIWFCRGHADLATSRENLGTSEALAEIDAAIGRARP